MTIIMTTQIPRFVVLSFCCPIHTTPHIHRPPRLTTVMKQIKKLRQKKQKQKGSGKKKKRSREEPPDSTCTSNAIQVIRNAPPLMEEVLELAHSKVMDVNEMEEEEGVEMEVEVEVEVEVKVDHTSHT